MVKTKTKKSSGPANNANKDNSNNEGRGLDDPRFASIASDPKFARISHRESKLKVDSRFQGMFDDPRFQTKYKVDKRGRPMTKTSSEDLKSYYRLSSDEDGNDDNEDESEEGAADGSEGGNGPSSSSASNKKLLTPDGSVNDALNVDDKKGDEDDEEVEEDEEEEEEGSSDDDEDVPIRLDLARGDGNMTSSDETTSDEDSQSDDEDADDGWDLGAKDGEEHAWGEMDKEAPTVDDASKRLAVCNMNWDRIKARDLLVLFNSFKPAGGVIYSVTIFPSDYGKERMAEEALKGPKELAELAEAEAKEREEREARRLAGGGGNLLDGSDDDSGVDEDREKDDEEVNLDEKETRENLKKLRRQREKIRKYQLQKLRYYYGVIETDSVATASGIYDECNGLEYENSADRIDLRFIPDGMKFEDSEIKDRADEVGDLTVYAPSTYVDTARQQSAVRLTWDENDPEREKTILRAFAVPKPKDGKKSTAMEEDDAVLNELSKYVASGSSSEDEEDAEAGGRRSNAYADLLRGVVDKTADPTKSSNKDLVEEEGMEMTWTADGDDAKDADGDADDSDDEEETRGKAAGKKERPWDQFLQRRKEKRRERKAEIKRKKQAIKDKLNGVNDEDEQDSANDKGDENGTLSLLMASGEANPLGNNDGTAPAGIHRKNYNLKKLLIAEREKTKLEGKKASKGNNRNKKENSAGAAIESTSSTLVGNDNKVDGDFAVNVQDPRFSALYNSHHFNIDPSDTNFKQTAVMKAILSEKVSRSAAKRARLDTEVGEAFQQATGGSSNNNNNNGIDASLPGGNRKKLKSDITSLAESVKLKAASLERKKQRREKLNKK